MTEREKLIENLEYVDNKTMPHLANTTKFIEAVADFILEDRERICAPLIKLGSVSRHSSVWNEGGISVERLCQAIEKIIKLAGLDKS